MPGPPNPFPLYSASRDMQSISRRRPKLTMKEDDVGPCASFTITEGGLLVSIGQGLL